MKRKRVQKKNTRIRNESIDRQIDEKKKTVITKPN